MSDRTAEERRIAELEAQVGALQSQLRTANPPAAVPSDEFPGLARCLTAGCPQVGDRPLTMRREQAVKLYDTSDGGIMRGVENSTVRAVPANDGDVVCPGCGEPSAVLESVPPNYPRVMAPPVKVVLG